ncbi:hydroxyacylglutathione hydrolase [Dysgonomonas sp. PH5-45]|uniref:MBL fold metallo-hydrolase n=1 Tax=unclassified Dysgonomonas TaxID=2630389 RepID=UPI002473FC4D|nr:MULTISPECIES: MBL fold metallo-hydrolase [unclassified Dysgonomonas]MDH6354804.1 hydroxyacylglutathione hydrolase [Dysgonomonas sp. PH5-45]MDH6387703.1 hydroxyacylglutathione hydrolase [Dysgonomonas sp. PH5-37]
MKINIFEFNPIAENTYLLYDDTKECVIIDAGCCNDSENKVLQNFITDNGLTVKHLINTHLHFDHVLGASFVCSHFGVVLEANAADKFLLEGMPAQMKMFGFPPVAAAPVIGKELNDGDVVEFGKQKLHVLHVPGHSPGHVVFYHKESDSLFTGDVLFRESIGRTDLAGGNHQQLVTGIKKKLLTLPPQTTVYPGHGPATTIGFEAENNPYL